MRFLKNWWWLTFFGSPYIRFPDRKHGSVGAKRTIVCVGVQMNEKVSNEFTCSHLVYKHQRYCYFVYTRDEIDVILPTTVNAAMLEV